jgi:hypothetical protein
LRQGMVGVAPSMKGGRGSVSFELGDGEVEAYVCENRERVGRWLEGL